MTGYWPSSLFACLWMFMDRDGVEVHKLAKIERGQYPAILTEQSWEIKDLLHGFRGYFSCGIRRVVPSGQDTSILSARVANHSAGFGAADNFRRNSRCLDKTLCRVFDLSSQSKQKLKSKRRSKIVKIYAN